MTSGFRLWTLSSFAIPSSMSDGEFSRPLATLNRLHALVMALVLEALHRAGSVAKSAVREMRRVVANRPTANGSRLSPLASDPLRGGSFLVWM